jgi:RNA polymerase sigma-70 factor (ECF subfamily)
VVLNEAAGPFGSGGGVAPLQREAVVLFEYQEMSLADIAAVCEIDVGTVKSRLHRARERLRRTLAPRLAGGPSAAAALAGERDTRP